MEWKDISSFSQSDKVREPRTFEARFGALRIVVTRHIHHSATDWVLICAPWFDNVVIGSGTSDEAKQSALLAIKNKVSSILRELDA